MATDRRRTPPSLLPCRHRRRPREDDIPIGKAIAGTACSCSTSTDGDRRARPPGRSSPSAPAWRRGYRNDATRTRASFVELPPIAAASACLPYRRPRSLRRAGSAALHRPRRWPGQAERLSPRPPRPGTALAPPAGILDCALLVRERNGVKQLLCAWTGKADASLQALLRQLPTWQRPHASRRVRGLPLTAHGVGPAPPRCAAWKNGWSRQRARSRPTRLRAAVERIAGLRGRPPTRFLPLRRKLVACPATGRPLSIGGCGSKPGTRRLGGKLAPRPVQPSHAQPRPGAGRLWNGRRCRSSRWCCRGAPERRSLRGGVYHWFPRAPGGGRRLAPPVPSERDRLRHQPMPDEAAQSLRVDLSPWSAGWSSASCSGRP